MYMYCTSMLYPDFPISQSKAKNDLSPFITFNVQYKHITMLTCKKQFPPKSKSKKPHTNKYTYFPAEPSASICYQHASQQQHTVWDDSKHRQATQKAYGETPQLHNTHTHTHTHTHTPVHTYTHAEENT